MIQAREVHMKKLWFPVIMILILLAGCAEDSTSASEVSIQPEMVLIPAGSFEMGCCLEDANLNEQPVHPVSVSSFLISKYEVTQQEFKQIMGFVPENGYGLGSDYPAFGITWEYAMQYCNARSDAEGLETCFNLADSTCNWTANGYRLPREAEWEYAARYNDSDTLFTYSGCDDVYEVAWFRRNSQNKVQKVGQKMPNALGLYDMSGNVWEWCWDWYADEYYLESPELDPCGPDTGLFRLVRGGCWYNDEEFCCCTYRAVSQSYGSNYIGLRVVRNAP
jgi:formylglycine-generating enzyme required for sulfatase activity